MSAAILDPQLGPGPGESFHPKSWAQARFLTSDAPELLYSGRLGGLKSRSACEKADLRCRMHANARVVLARKRRTDLGATTMKIMLEQTITPALRAHGYRGAADGGSMLRYPNGSEILFVGLDDPGKLRSGEFDLILIDQCEEIDEEEWDTAAGRLRWSPKPWIDESGVAHPAYRQIAGVCNPSDPSHFLFRRFKPDSGSRQWVDTAGTLQRETILTGATDGFDILPADYIARLDRYKGRFRDRYVLGLWLANEGSVYGDVWDPGVHIVRRPASWAPWGGYPPPDWPRYRAIDFGFTNPFVCQWWARDPDETFYLYREIYYTKRTVLEHKRQIVSAERHELATLQAKAREQGVEVPQWLNVDMSIADHDAGDRALLETADADCDVIATSPAVKDVSAGIQTVYELLAPFTVNGELRSRLRFVSDALLEVDPALADADKPTCTIQEIPRYRFPKGMSTSVTDASREAPFKANDHGCDAMRYLFHTIKGRGEANIIVIR